MQTVAHLVGNSTGWSKVNFLFCSGFTHPQSTCPSSLSCCSEKRSIQPKQIRLARQLRICSLCGILTTFGGFSCCSSSTGVIPTSWLHRAAVEKQWGADAAMPHLACSVSPLSCWAWVVGVWASRLRSFSSVSSCPTNALSCRSGLMCWMTTTMTRIPGCTNCWGSVVLAAGTAPVACVHCTRTSLRAGPHPTFISRRIEVKERTVIGYLICTQSGDRLQECCVSTSRWLENHNTYSYLVNRAAEIALW